MPLTINENLIMNEQVQDLLDGKSVDIGDCVSEHGQGFSISADDIDELIQESPEFSTVLMYLRLNDGHRATQEYQKLFEVFGYQLIKDSIAKAVANKELDERFLDEAA
jgi:hypothetical protein